MDELRKNELKNMVEAILFAWGEGVEIKDLAKVLNATESEISYIGSILIDDYKCRGIRISRTENTLWISTNPKYVESINEFVKDDGKKNLSNANLETLSIIAYSQPITKIEIDSIRGVKSDATINNLLNLNLIETVGRLDRIGRPLLYGTTKEFLRRFGIESLDKLPEVDKIKNISFLEEK